MKQLLNIILAIFDLFPGRKEKLLNAIDNKKEELKRMRLKPGTWTARDSARYYKLTDELSALEKRARNAGF